VDSIWRRALGVRRLVFGLADRLATHEQPSEETRCMVGRALACCLDPSRRHCKQVPASEHQGIDDAPAFCHARSTRLSSLVSMQNCAFLFCGVVKLCLLSREINPAFVSGLNAKMCLFVLWCCQLGSLGLSRSS
jgi:hypothetical protein